MDQNAHSHGQTGSKSVTDPVCGMAVDPHSTPHRHIHAGRPYYFCSAGCRSRFAADPQKYLSPAALRPEESAPEGAIYTCPMHPEIRQPGPGSCPICGMALEPEIASRDEGPNRELADMTRRFWIGLALTVPVFVVEMRSSVACVTMRALNAGKRQQVAAQSSPIPS